MSSQHHPHESRMIKAVFSRIPQIYSVGSYIKLSGIHGGWCWFDMNISIGTHQIFINLVSVQRKGIYLSDNVKKLQKLGILV